MPRSSENIELKNDNNFKISKEGIIYLDIINGTELEIFGNITVEGLVSYCIIFYVIN